MQEKLLSITAVQTKQHSVYNIFKNLFVYMSVTLVKRLHNWVFIYRNGPHLGHGNENIVTIYSIWTIDI